MPSNKVTPLKNSVSSNELILLPCGTPDILVNCVEQEEFNFTLTVLYHEYDLSHEEKLWEAPSWEIILIRIMVNQVKRCFQIRIDYIYLSLLIVTERAGMNPCWSVEM